MWNDRDTPIAYLITFRTYGTWLHGDERGSTDRHNKIYGNPHYHPDPRWQTHNEKQLSHEPVTLDAARRQAIECALTDTCRRRFWGLMAHNIRTNHAHVVVDTLGKAGSLALNAFKANATREMRQRGLWQINRSPWSDKGSIRHLWNEQSVAAAIEYVLHGQGGELQKFDF
jgi:REP element-mobilizing transposase RayT